MKKYFLLNILLSLSVLGFGQASNNFNLSGQITCQSGSGMEGVHLTLLFNGQLIDSVSTDQDGNYQFSELQRSANTGAYQLEVFYLGQALNGVSTFDMVVGLRHIIGVETLSPIQVSAGDINRSGSFTTFDLVQMRALILSAPQSALVPHPDWIFYREVNGQIQEGTFIIPGNDGNQTLNIQGIKRGDFNGSAICR